MFTNINLTALLMICSDKKDPAPKIDKMKNWVALRYNKSKCWVRWAWQQDYLILIFFILSFYRYNSLCYGGYPSHVQSFHLRKLDLSLLIFRSNMINFIIIINFVLVVKIRDNFILR